MAYKIIAAGYLSLGAALMYIWLVGVERMKIEVVPQGESQEDDKVRKPDFQKSKQAVG